MKAHMVRKEFWGIESSCFFGYVASMGFVPKREKKGKEPTGAIPCRRMNLIRLYLPR